MFRFASQLLPAQPALNDFRVIQLDEARLQKPEGIREFRFFLRKLRKSHAAEIVWLSDDFPQMDYVQVEEEKPESKSSKSKTGKSKNSKSKTSKSKASSASSNDDEQQWQPTQGERNKLAWMLENQHVFLTQYNNVPDQQHYIPYR